MGEEEGPLTTSPAICGDGPWTRERIAEDLFFAEAYGRTLGLDTVRAIAFAMLEDDLRAEPHAAKETGVPAGTDGTDGDDGSSVIPAHAAPIALLATDGALTDLDALWTCLSVLGTRTPDPLVFAGYVGAIEAFLDAVPPGPQVWLSRPHATAGWVGLDRDDAELRLALGSAPPGAVLGSSGLGHLDTIDVHRHEYSRRWVLEDDPDTLDDLDDAVFGDVWAWHHLATGWVRHGEPYEAWVKAHGGALMRSSPFEETYRGPVDGIEAFCFSIGVRDGWWLPAEALAADHALGPVLEVDTTAMWALYEARHWEIVDGRSSANLFAPLGHVGPPPSVAELRAESHWRDPF